MWKSKTQSKETQIKTHLLKIQILVSVFVDIIIFNLLLLFCPDDTKHVCLKNLFSLTIDVLCIKKQNLYII